MLQNETTRPTMDETHANGASANGTSANGDKPTRRPGFDPLMQVRASDVEPYTGLGYLSKLFRLISIFLVALLVIEVATGLYQQGREALPTLFSEVSRLVVLAGLLWGVGDLAKLLIDVGHDVRATRILLGRQVAHATTDRPPERVVERATERERAVEHAAERSFGPADARE